MNNMASLWLKLCPFIATMFMVTHGVLPPYIPAMEHAVSDRDSIIVRYFHLGFGYAEILGFLCVVHGINLSLRQLKRILFKKDLKKRKIAYDPEDILSALEQELSRSGSSLGYRQMQLRLRLDYGISLNREMVRKSLALLDPEGVSRRSRHKLRRRQYYSKGPNYLWQLDGYDKLKPFGFCIHGAIDGFSRRIVWLEVGPTNNNPRVIATYFHECVKQLGGVPFIFRGDAGTENVYVAAMQRFFRRDGFDEFSGGKSFLYGRSVSNQRIEGWWSYLRKTETDWWINYFKDLRDQGLYDDSNPIHCECLKFCYMPLLKEELQRVAQQWNMHRIRRSTNANSPSGRPDTIFFIPEAFDSTSYLQDVSLLDLEVAKDMCCEIPNDPFHENFTELAEIIMSENNLEMPGYDIEKAEHLYIDLLGYIENLM